MELIRYKRTLYMLALLGISLCFLGACSIKQAPEKTPVELQAQKSAEQAPQKGETEAEPDLTNPDEPLIAVYVGNRLYDVAVLSDEKIIKVDQGDGKVNEITLTGHSVYMSHSTCDNQDCVRQGAITKENRETRVLMDFIICLPNQVTIEFIAEAE